MTLKKYNPALLSDGELVEGFVVRHDKLQELLEILHDNTGPANQHAIVIAPRGFGRSTLVLRTAVEVRRDPQLSSRIFPVVFPEESYQVSSVGELWLEALLQLSCASGEAHLRKAWEQLRKDRDEERLAARALGALLDFADARRVRLLLVIENLDQLLDGQISKDDAWTLRKTLLNEPRIMVLATAVHRFEGLDQPDQAMFDLFRGIEMDALSPRECDRVWGRVTGARIGTRRAKAVRILTGGNPRLVVMLSGFAQGGDLSGLPGALDGLIDDNTGTFRQNIEALHGQLRKVFLALAELWRPSPARSVAEAARLEVNETSAALSRLLAQGRVEIARDVGKNHLYQVSGRLDNIYYLTRRRGGMEARVRALLEFLITLFEASPHAVAPADHTQVADGTTLAEPEGPWSYGREEPPAVKELHGPIGARLALIGAIRGPDAAAASLGKLLVSERLDRLSLLDVLRAAMRVAAADAVAPLVNALQCSPRAGEVEPLIAALRLRQGEIVDAPIEILEVAEEVNKRIDALAATGDVWQIDPLAIMLPDEQDLPTDGRFILY